MDLTSAIEKETRDTGKNIAGTTGNIGERKPGLVRKILAGMVAVPLGIIVWNEHNQAYHDCVGDYRSGGDRCGGHRSPYQPPPSLPEFIAGQYHNLL